MKEILADIARWQAEGKRFATAKVVGIEGSSPREIGATMAVNEDGVVAGSVSGGCVEGAVVAEALAALGAQEAVLRSVGVVDRKVDLIGCARTLSYGYSDDEAFAVGLTCGGTLLILIDPEPPQYLEDLRELVSTGRPYVIATVFASSDEGSEETGEYFTTMNQGLELPRVGSSMMIREDGSTVGSLGNPELDRVVGRDALGALASATTTKRHYGRSGQSRAQEVGVVFDVSALPPKMVIFGAVDFTAALAKIAKLLGYTVTVCDARPIFATPERFPMADEVVVDWPDRYLEKHRDSIGKRDAICVLTHDPKFDVPALTTALKTDAGYIGAMGSRRTHEDRLRRLEEHGVDLTEVNERVMGPIGLDLGARTPEETAISILAEIVAKREGKSGPFLREGSGRIHQSNEAARL
jgi:xanthine dehydrogenase accessory factor